MLTNWSGEDRMGKFIDNRAGLNMDGGPIIRSLLDLDFYKLTMLKLVWKYFRDVLVNYAFKNRTKSVILFRQISPGTGSARLLRQRNNY